MNISRAAKIKISGIENSLKHLTNEKVVIVDAKTLKTVKEKIGTQNNVYLNWLEISARKNRSIATHQHFFSELPGLNDIDAGIKLNLIENRVFDPMNNRIHLIEYPKIFPKPDQRRADQILMRFVNIFKKSAPDAREPTPEKLEKFNRFYKNFYRTMRKKFEKEIPGMKFRTILHEQP